MFVNETPIPFSLYCVKESTTIDFKSAPIDAAVALFPSTFNPILSVMKFVQFLTYGDLHLPLGPAVAGPGSRYPAMALSGPEGGGNATQAPPR